VPFVRAAPWLLGESLRLAVRWGAVRCATVGQRDLSIIEKGCVFGCADWLFVAFSFGAAQQEEENVKQEVEKKEEEKGASVLPAFHTPLLVGVPRLLKFYLLVEKCRHPKSGFPALLKAPECSTN
jgi:hypothetical protein